jgi:hypothetical protein
MGPSTRVARHTSSRDRARPRDDAVLSSIPAPRAARISGSKLVPGGTCRSGRHSVSMMFSPRVERANMFCALMCTYTIDNGRHMFRIDEAGTQGELTDSRKRDRGKGQSHTHATMAELQEEADASIRKKGYARDAVGASRTLEISRRCAQQLSRWRAA